MPLAFDSNDPKPSHICQKNCALDSVELMGLQLLEFVAPVCQHPPRSGPAGPGGPDQAPSSTGLRPRAPPTRQQPDVTGPGRPVGRAPHKPSRLSVGLDLTRCTCTMRDCRSPRSFGAVWLCRCGTSIMSMGASRFAPTSTIGHVTLTPRHGGAGNIFAALDLDSCVLHSAHRGTVENGYSTVALACLEIAPSQRFTWLPLQHSR